MSNVMYVICNSFHQNFRNLGYRVIIEVFYDLTPEVILSLVNSAFSSVRPLSINTISFGVLFLNPKVILIAFLYKVSAFLIDALPHVSQPYNKEALRQELRIFLLTYWCCCTRRSMSLATVPVSENIAPRYTYLEQ